MSADVLVPPAGIYMESGMYDVYSYFGNFVDSVFRPSSSCSRPRLGRIIGRHRPMWFLVILVAAAHYMYMRVYWVQVHKSTFVYRYVVWSIAVPLQMNEFNLILKAAQKLASSPAWADGATSFSRT